MAKKPATKKRIRQKKKSDRRPKIRPDEVEPKKPGGLPSPTGPGTTPKPGTVGGSTKKMTPRKKG